jgi:hypothetical protein
MQVVRKGMHHGMEGFLATSNGSSRNTTIELEGPEIEHWNGIGMWKYYIC